MKISRGRIGLLTGASISAFGLASPAFAAANPGIDHSVASATVNDTLTICLTDYSCNFGAAAEGSGLVTANLNDVASGQIRQVGTATGAGGDVALQMINSGDATLSAFADASGSAGIASALAQIGSAVVQTGVGSGDVAIDLVNNGTMLINAAASASAPHAFAAASVNGGIHQFADSTGTGNASAAMTNAGDLNITAAAKANGTTAANAVAEVRRGIGDYAAANGPDDALANLKNSGDISISAAASAAIHGTAGNANAFAVVSNAIQQTVYAQSGLASANIDNGGTISIDAHAAATGVTTAPLAGGSAVNATAYAADSFAIDQTGTAASGNVALDLNNSGTISIAADATALASMDTDGTVAGNAYATAYVRHAEYQKAYSPHGDVDIGLTNAGTLNVAALAAASGNNAHANATIKSGVSQAATETGGHSDLTLLNTGTISVGEVAKAVATGGSATAHALIQGGIRQMAGGDVARASFTNAGTITVAADGSAVGETRATASVFVRTGIEQLATGSGEASASLTNSGTIDFSADASAKVLNALTDLAAASATAGVNAIMQFAMASITTHSSGMGASGSAFLKMGHDLFGPVSLSLSNSGDIEVGAHASAIGVAQAVANASAQVVRQDAFGSSASISLTNEGKIAVSAVAQAKASQVAVAGASAEAIDQFATAQTSSFLATATAGGAEHIHFYFGPTGPVSLSLVNTGTISILADAHATDTGTAVAASHSAAVAAAAAHVPIGINQGALGLTAEAQLTNDGSITIGASAVAHGLRTGQAFVQAEGIAQGAIALARSSSLSITPSGSGSYTGALIWLGNAKVGLTNSGTLSVKALGSADAGLNELGVVSAQGVAQIARAFDASVTALNSGTIDVVASMHGAASRSAINSVNALGINQEAIAPDHAAAKLVNSGSIDVEAFARGTAKTGYAGGSAHAHGIVQVAYQIGGSTSDVTNTGSLSVTAVTQSKGGTMAVAAADAHAVMQMPGIGTVDAALDNQGDLSALAAASAAATGEAFALALATGEFAAASNVAADIANGGHIVVGASAHAAGASGIAMAFANGIFIAASGTSAGEISGSIVNSGELDVSAKVDSKSSGTVAATATGIGLSSTRDNAVVTNSGKILVEAVSGHGGPATAYGVHVTAGSYGAAPAPGDLFTFTNDGGTLIVRQSDDGGTTWKHGMAIDVSAAPNASAINLIGNGTIYGDIAVQDDDNIDVKAGTTYFDGIINPSFVPAGGITTVTLDSGLSGVGTLTIADGGNLVLADARLTGPASMYDGPSYALVDTLSVASDGTLTFELQPASGGAQPAGSYPQVFANTANLGGTLVADVTPANGLFADSYSWQNVIDANVLTGKFDKCLLGGAYTGSLLLDLTCSYDSNANVDLALTRKAFEAPTGLNANATSVGTGLDSVYNVNLTGGEAHLFGDLFRFTDAAKYNWALNMLSGSVYANYLNSFPSLGVHENDLTDHATDCDAPVRSALACRTSGPIHLWGQLDYQARKADGDVEAGDSRSKRFTGLLGIDGSLGSATILGIDAGYLSNNLRESQFGDNVNGNGWTAGAYAVYDPGAFFLKAVTTYASLDGNSQRHINFNGLGAGTNFVANPTGRPDVRMWSFGLHGGARFSMSASSLVTPYLNYDYANAKLDGFTENNGGGAALTFTGSKSNHSFLTGGVKWAGQLGGVVPELNVGYRYRFGDQRSTFNAFLDGDAENNFDVVSSAQKRGAFLAGVRIGGKIGQADVSIGYEGEFNGDVTSHSGNFKIVLPLGGHAAPLPPPPPPPPAPVERDERGE